MLYATIWVSFVFLYGTKLAQAACNADNCLRAVAASAFPTRHGSADCASYFMVTVTPSITTTTPSNIPAYASPCSGSARYSSACSCIGATHGTTTAAPTPTACANPEPTFILQLENSGIVLNGIPLDGTFANLDDGDGYIIGFNGYGRDQAVSLSLNPAGNLVIDEVNEVAYRDAPQLFELMHFDTPENLSDPAAADVVLVVCSIADGTLKCDAAGSNILQLCPGAAVTNDVWIGNVVSQGCTSATFKAIPVCTL